MGMHSEQLTAEARKKLNRSMSDIVGDVSHASRAVIALSEMMQEYSVFKNWSSDAINHIECGMWLCAELGSHQQMLLERLETTLLKCEHSGAPESLLADSPSFSDSLSLAARSVAPAAS